MFWFDHGESFAYFENFGILSRGLSEKGHHVED